MIAGTCRACAGTWPSATEHVAAFPHTTAYLHEDQFFQGWTVLVLKRQLPHVHWYLIPRLAGDPAAGETVWSRPHPSRVLPPEERDALIGRIRAHLC